MMNGMELELELELEPCMHGDDLTSIEGMLRAATRGCDAFACMAHGG